MATHKASTSVSTVVGTRKSFQSPSDKRACLLLNALLTNPDILKSEFSVSDEFLGPNKVRRDGDFGSGTVTLPFKSLLRYGKPRRLKHLSAGTDRKPLPKDARTALLDGFDLVGGSFEYSDAFVSPTKVIRQGEHEPDGADFVIPTSRLSFSAHRRSLPSTQGRNSADVVPSTQPGRAVMRRLRRPYAGTVTENGRTYKSLKE